MKISAFKSALGNVEEIVFQLPNHQIVPVHFHVTEIGVVSKNFIDCGGTIREEKTASFQLWEANDFQHRLKPGKLIGIINKADKIFNILELEIEVEYQQGTINRFGLDFDGKTFLLTPIFTDCLAQDSCGIPKEKLKVNMSELITAEACCTPGASCC